MFDFLKRKKEDEFTEVSEESSDSGASELESFRPRFPDVEPKKPEFFSGNSGSGVSEKDIQLILAKIELLHRKIEDVDEKVSEVLEIAKQSK